MFKFNSHFFQLLTNQARDLGQIDSGLQNPLEPKNLNNVNEIRTLLNRTVSILLGLLTVLAALYFLFQIIMAGYTWMSAGGDSSKAADARNRLTYGIMGLAIVVAAYTIVGLITSIFGIPVFNPLFWLQEP